MVVRHAALCAVLLGTVIATKTESDGFQDAMDTIRRASSVLRNDMSKSRPKKPRRRRSQNALTNTAKMTVQPETIPKGDEELDDMDSLSGGPKSTAAAKWPVSQPSDKHSSQHASQLSRRREVRMTASQANLSKQQNQAREALSLLRALGLDGIAEELEWVRRIIRRIKKKAVK